MLQPHSSRLPPVERLSVTHKVAGARASLALCTAAPLLICQICTRARGSGGHMGLIVSHRAAEEEEKDAANTPKERADIEGTMPA